MFGATTEARAWLPPAALADGRIDAIIRGAVEAWSAKWIARGEVRARPLLAPGDAEPEGPWRALAEGAALGVGESGRLALAAAMLDAPVSAKSLAETDRAVCERLADGAVADLCRRLSTAFRLPDSSQWREVERLPFDDGLGCEIGGDPLSPMIRLRLSRELAVAIRKSCAASVPRPIELRPLDEGLARQGIRLSARLGRCNLTLAEFAGLAGGDVLILDEDPGRPLDLAVAGGPPVARGAIHEDGAGYRLNILETTQSTGT